ncbi:MAG: hypothetical protein M1818_008081 [Claussenomyces sp. TS43310]|nr:MAG: hypothetical protein M1818_008081 [Claussenomyces sp. TS43310]
MSPAGESSKGSSAQEVTMVKGDPKSLNQLHSSGKEAQRKRAERAQMALDQAAAVEAAKQNKKDQKK